MSWRGRGQSPRWGTPAPDPSPAPPPPSGTLGQPFWASVSLWLRPLLAAPALPPSTSHTGQIVHKKRSQGSLSSLERPHKCKALLASLLLNINNDISIVHYKPEKKLQEPWVEMAKRIIRPLRATGPFRPSRNIRKADVGGVLRFPFQPPAQFNLAPPGPTRIMLFPVPSNPLPETRSPPLHCSFPFRRHPQPIRQNLCPSPSSRSPPSEPSEQPFSPVYSPVNGQLFESLLGISH